MAYGERDGIWHVIQDGKALCAAETEQPIELDFEPRPMCWRCREAERRVSGMPTAIDR